MALIDRFTGPEGGRALHAAIKASKLAHGQDEVSEALIAVGEVIEYVKGTALIEQGGDDNHVLMIVAGSCDIVVNGRTIAHRGPGDHLGEMSAIEPAQQRSASVVAATDVVALKVDEPSFHKVAHEYPAIYKCIAQELSRRLLQRNSQIGAYREKVRLFIISSVESLPIARAIQNAFEHDPFHVVIWTDGVFKVTNYTLQSLEDEVNKSDFAIAVAHADDLTASRGSKWPAPRDNVVFELGLFMGRLGRARAILMEPRDERVKLPSDLAGVTTIPYKFDNGSDGSAAIGPACNKLREHIISLGPNNG